jgi:FAD/FMN-containing dehydrogenase
MKNKLLTQNNFPEISHQSTSEIVNDKHSQMNVTIVSEVLKPRTIANVTSLIDHAQSKQKCIATCGGRHAMGGQQFLTNQILVDMVNMNKVIRFDKQHGLIEVESGIYWSDLIDYLSSNQVRDESPWSIAQKQTGCDRLSLGGSLSANMHGRALKKAPFVEDIENFSIVLSDGQVKRCNRNENTQLFHLAIGGYGLFGVVVSITIRLVKSSLLQRNVELVSSSEAIEKLEFHPINGATYGDFQFSIDNSSKDFLQTGILSTYTPIGKTSKILQAPQQKTLSSSDWHNLIHLAHTDKAQAFAKYVHHYLSTDKQIYELNKMQLSTYVEGYHERMNSNSSCVRGSEMITELYVPRNRLHQFLSNAAGTLRAGEANLIYGTVRLIEKDNETLLPWARNKFACIIFNLHVQHSVSDIDKNKKIFRDIIQHAIDLDGSFYLTYHPYASKEQILNCYPQIYEFFRQKSVYDPQHTFGSNWYMNLLSLIS